MPYDVRGFRIIVFGTDVKFKALQDRSNCDLSLNVVCRGECVLKIKCWYRVAKERFRCYYAMLHVDQMLRMMVVHLLITVVLYFNAFAWTKGESKTLPPFTIFEGMALDFNLHFRVMRREIFKNAKAHVTP